MTAQALALFDLDNTLLDGDSDYEWAQFLIEEGVLDRERYEARNHEFYMQYKAGCLDILEFLDFQLAPLARYPSDQLDRWHAAFMARKIAPMIPASSGAPASPVGSDSSVMGCRPSVVSAAIAAGSCASGTPR